MSLRQREPRVRDNRHLDFIRSQPCCICGGIDTEAAHIRTGSIGHGKPSTGMAEKPSDKWTLPLCNRHHREQHTMNEMAFWKKYEIDPFMLAITIRTRCGVQTSDVSVDCSCAGDAGWPVGRHDVTCPAFSSTNLGCK